MDQARMGSDRRKHPQMYAYHTLTAGELRDAFRPAWPDRPVGGWFIATDGTLREWRVNGALKEWKLDPTRFRLPAKYGFREAFAWTDGQDGKVRVEGSGLEVFPVLLLGEAGLASVG